MTTHGRISGLRIAGAIERKEVNEMDDDVDPQEYEYFPRCPECNGSGLSMEGWDCEECDGLGYWEI